LALIIADTDVLIDALQGGEPEPTSSANIFGWDAWRLR
jgi:hypothetical protein